MITPQMIKQLFLSAVHNVTAHIKDFSLHPGIDFSRTRKLPPDTLIRLLVAEGASSTRVELLDFFGVDQAGVFEPQIDHLLEFGVFRTVGAMPVIKRDVKAVKILFATGGDFGNKLLRRDAFFLSGDHDRRAVGVIGAHEMHRIAAHSLMTNPDVGLDVLHDVADVKGPVGIGQSGSDKEIALFGCHEKMQNGCK